MRGRYTIQKYVGVMCWYMFSSCLLYGGLTQKVAVGKLVNEENTNIVLQSINTILGYDTTTNSFAYDLSTMNVSEVVELASKLYAKSYNKIENEYTWNKLFHDDTVEVDSPFFDFLMFYNQFLEQYRSYCKTHHEKIKAYLKDRQGCFKNKTLHDWLSEEISKEGKKDVNKRCYSKFEVFLLLDPQGLADLKNALNKGKNKLSYGNELRRVVSAYGGDMFDLFKRNKMLDTVLESNLSQNLKVNSNQQASPTQETDEQAESDEDRLHKLLLHSGEEITLERARLADAWLDQLPHKKSAKYAEMRRAVDQVMGAQVPVSPSAQPVNNSDDPIEEDTSNIFNKPEVTQFLYLTEKEKQIEEGDESASSSPLDDEEVFRLPSSSLGSKSKKKEWWEICSLLQGGLLVGGLVVISLGTGVFLVKKTAWGKRLWQRLRGQEEESSSLDANLENVIEDIMALYRQVGLSFEERKKRQAKLIENLSPSELEVVQEEVKKRLFASRWYDYGFFLYEQDARHYAENG